MLSLPRQMRRQLERRFDNAKRKGRIVKVAYSPGILSPVGQPVSIPDPDVKVQRTRQEAALAQGKATYAIPTIEADFADMALHFCNNIPWERDAAGKTVWKPTIEDTGNAYAVIKAFRKVKGTDIGFVEIEDQVYRWFMDKLKGTEGFACYGMIREVLVEKMENIIKEA